MICCNKNCDNELTEKQIKQVETNRRKRTRSDGAEPKWFCSRACSSAALSEKTISYCEYCGNQVTKTGRKYCSQLCASAHVRWKAFNLIDNGDTSLPTRNYREYLIAEHGAKCMDCGWSVKNEYSNKVPIELEHIDGNSENNSLNNLKLLCPNCHSLTPTYKGLNYGKGRHKRRERYAEGKSY